MAGDNSRHAAAIGFLDAYGIEANSTNLTQLNVLVEALQIFETRKIYGDVWRKYGALSNLLSVARKADRLMEIFWHGPGELDHKSSVDDAYDLINYAAFFIRNVTDGNLKGI